MRGDHPEAVCATEAFAGGFHICHRPMTKPFSQVHHQMLKRMVRSSALAIVPPPPDQNIATVTTT